MVESTLEKRYLERFMFQNYMDQLTINGDKFKAIIRKFKCSDAYQSRNSLAEVGSLATDLASDLIMLHERLPRGTFRLNTESFAIKEIIADLSRACMAGPIILSRRQGAKCHLLC
jgi:hypothetical protein